MRKSVLSVLSSVAVIGVVLFGLIQQPTVSHGYDYRYYFDKYDITVVENPQINTTFPYWAKPNPKQDITDPNYWIATIPFVQDREADAFLVYPKAGVATVVLRPNEKDQVLIEQGQMFDHYKYLTDGSLHYYGPGPMEGDGNMVIAAHSSFKMDDPGRYNTVFQTLPITREGDKVFYYERTEGNNFDFYAYTVQKSFETHSNDTGILKGPSDQGKFLTTYGCYTLGTNESRWVNVAKLTEHKTDLLVSQPKIYAQLATFSQQKEHAAADEQYEAPERLPEKVAEQTQTDTQIVKKAPAPKIVENPVNNTPYGNMPAYIQNRTMQQPAQHTQQYMPPTIQISDSFAAEYQPLIDKLRFLIKIRTDENKALIRIVADRIQERFGDKLTNPTPSKKVKLLGMLLEKMEQFVADNTEKDE